MNKFDAASESNAVSYPELLDDLESNVMITGYRLHSTSFGVEGVKIPAYQGSLSLKLLGPQQLVNLVHMLLRFGTYSGVGIKTAMGMGAFQIAEREKYTSSQRGLCSMMWERSFIAAEMDAAMRRADMLS